MKLVWLPTALHDLANIKHYYAQSAGNRVANTQMRKILEAGAFLQQHPYIGRLSDDDANLEIHEWIIPSTHYTLPYLIEDEAIKIIRVFDQKQLPPDSWAEWI